MATYDFTALVVAGGGGGGGTQGSAYAGAGGGGAGGYQEDSALTLTETTSYTITVGGGGAGNTGTGKGDDGSDSSIGAALVSTGGGGGGGNSSLNGGTGGSGGGGSANNGSAGTGTAGQGNDGGAGNANDDGGGGGGGGAGATGSAGGADDGADGGAGTASTITGSSVTRGGGGGGGDGDFGGGNGGAGGAGGGGLGGGYEANGANATANTGGGGGGAGCYGADGGNGGSGVVIIRFTTADVIVTDSTNGTINTDGTDTYITWNSSGSFEFILASSIPTPTACDFMVRRNASDSSSTIPDAGTNYDAKWDTLDDSEGGTIIYSGGTFTFGDGKYLVLYSERFDTADTAGSRIEGQGRLLVNGTATDIGATYGYIRKADGQQEMILAGGGILDVSSGANTLKTRFYRTDSTSDSGVTRQTGWGGISILALDSSWNYARYSLSSPATIPNAFADVVWDTSDEQDTGFSRSSGEVTITTAGRYVVSYSIPVTLGSSARSLYKSRITLNDVEVTGTKPTCYIRGADGCDDGVLAYTGIIDVAANDVLALETNVIDGDTTATIGAGTNMQIWQLPSSAETIILEATTGDMNPSTLTEFEWDTNPHIDTDSFTHTAATSVFQVDAADDYLFFVTLQASSGPARAYPTGRISVNDTIKTIGAGGQYNRAATLNDGVGYSFGLLAGGLSANDAISAEVIELAASGTVNNTLGAMSGLRISTLKDAGANTRRYTLPVLGVG